MGKIPKNTMTISQYWINMMTMNIKNICKTWKKKATTTLNLNLESTGQMHVLFLKILISYSSTDAYVHKSLFETYLFYKCVLCQWYTLLCVMWTIKWEILNKNYNLKSKRQSNKDNAKLKLCNAFMMYIL